MKAWLAVAIGWLAVSAACNDVNSFDERALGPNGVLVRGDADFTRYVAIGDSYAAGVVNGAFTCSGQIFAYPALIARQVGLGVADACNPPEALPADFSAFQQPLVTDPGLGSPLVLEDPGPPPVITSVDATGQPTNGDLPRPYNDLGVPGADLREVNVARNQATSLDGNPAFNVVLRGIGTAPEQARTLDATFVTFWLGGNDVLGSVLAGGTIPVTPPAVFETEYNRALDALLEVTPQVVVANVTDVTFFPFVTAIPPAAVNPATGQPVLVGGAPVALLGPDGPLALGRDFVLLTAAPLLAQGAGIPAALGGTGAPLPDDVVLQASEVAAIREAAAAYNVTIANAVAARGLAMVDLDRIAREALAAGGVFETQGEVLSLRFLGGGTGTPFFGLDGFHPTPKGYGALADLFLETINQRFGASIPLVDVAELPTLIGPPLLADLAGLPELLPLGNPFLPVVWPERIDTTLW